MDHPWDQVKIKDIDTTKEEELLIREQVHRILNCSAHRDFNIIQWQNPKIEMPQEASFVLIKEPAGSGLGFLCTEVAYEHGRFWYVWPDYRPVPAKNVLLWTYAPFDDRVNFLGQLLPVYRQSILEN